MASCSAFAGCVIACWWVWEYLIVMVKVTQTQYALEIADSKFTYPLGIYLEKMEVWIVPICYFKLSGCQTGSAETQVTLPLFS